VVETDDVSDMLTASIIKARCEAETSVNFNQIIQLKNPEDSNHNTRPQELPEFVTFSFILESNFGFVMSFQHILSLTHLRRSYLL
jgi:hypothetical protein